MGRSRVSDKRSRPMFLWRLLVPVSISLLLIGLWAMGSFADLASGTVRAVDHPIAPNGPAPGVFLMHTNAQVATPTPTPTPGYPSPCPTSTGEPTDPLPDLVVRGLGITLETGGACDYGSTQLGVMAVIGNAGNAGAGSFVVEVNGARQKVIPGLAVQQTIFLWFPGFVYHGDNVAFVDAECEIEESNEENNLVVRWLPIPTLPPTCTPSATPTPTPSSILSPSESPWPVPEATTALLLVSGLGSLSGYVAFQRRARRR